MIPACRGWVLAVCLAVTGTSARGLQSTPVPAPGTPVQAAALQSLEPVNADPEFAGRFSPGRFAVRTLTFRNRLRVPVEVAIASKTSGCLDATFEPATVPPGEMTKVTLRAVVPPQMGEQVQSAGFTCTWMQDGDRRSERGRVGLRYMALIDYSAFPASLVISAVMGSDAAVHVVLRALSDSERAPETEPPVCSLPG